jgi:hypothetical protein
MKIYVKCDYCTSTSILKEKNSKEKCECGKCGAPLDLKNNIIPMPTDGKEIYKAKVNKMMVTGNNNNCIQENNGEGENSMSIKGDGNNCIQGGGEK